MLLLAEENDKFEMTLPKKDKDINIRDEVIAQNAEILSKNEVEISQLKATNDHLMAKVSSLEITNEEALALGEKSLRKMVGRQKAISLRIVMLRIAQVGREA
ncbi:hypothetical protein Scep_006813 [Stephania cephalantha]|uniref:Uncharacterized protein n=1 Tax=Stephania cephalantha TaxID=152367 RepID=A0AAP0K8N9_9MAGN